MELLIALHSLSWLKGEKLKLPSNCFMREKQHQRLDVFYCSLSGRLLSNFYADITHNTVLRLFYFLMQLQGFLFHCDYSSELRLA